MASYKLIDFDSSPRSLCIRCGTAFEMANLNLGSLFIYLENKAYSSGASRFDSYIFVSKR